MRFMYIYAMLELCICIQCEPNTCPYKYEGSPKNNRNGSTMDRTSVAHILSARYVSHSSF